MRFKVGDKVRYKHQDPADNVEVGEVGTICGISEVTGNYGVAFETKDVFKHNCGGLCRDNYGWWCNENALEPVVPTLAEIKEKMLTCCINVRSIAEAQFLDDFFECKSYLKKYCENAYKERMRLGYYRTLEDGVAFQLTDGVINDNCSANFYRSCGGRYGEVYEFSDLFPVGSTMMCGDRMYQRTESGITNYKLVPNLDLSLILPTNLRELEEKFNKELANHFNAFPNNGISAKNGGKNSMKFTFYVTEGTRPDKSPEGDGKGVIPTMTTEVIYKDNDGCANGGSATCDKADYNERQGCLEAIANAVLGGNFDREYEKFLADKKHKYDESCKCKICGCKYYEDEKTGKRTPFTPEDARKHEEWHEQNKKNKREKYLIRKEAKRRLAEAEREGKIEQTMKELYKK